MYDKKIISVKLKLLFIAFTFLCINLHAQDYIFGKITSEEKTEMPNVTVINIRTDERVNTNDDGHFMIAGRQGDLIRFIKLGYERVDKRVTKDNLASPLNIILPRSATLIDEVKIKKQLTGDLKIDAKTYNAPKKVEKLKADIGNYINTKSDPRILAAKPGEFVQPKGQGFVVGKIKNKWDDVDLMKYLNDALGPQYFKDLKIDPSLSMHFINYVITGGFERQKILKYGYVSDADFYRFQRAVMQKIESYKAPLSK